MKQRSFCYYELNILKFEMYKFDLYRFAAVTRGNQLLRLPRHRAPGVSRCNFNVRWWKGALLVDVIQN